MKTIEEIEITSMRYSSDWCAPEKHIINLSEIVGFELSFRCSSWHIVKVNKKMIEGKYYREDLSHYVEISEVVKLLNDERVNILEISNMHNIKNFIKNISFLFNRTNCVNKVTSI